VQDSSRGRAIGLRVVGAMKLSSGVLLAAAGFGIFRYINRDLGASLEHFISRLHLDPENRVLHTVISQVASIDHKHLVAIGAGTFFYAFLHLVEGTGLLLLRRWAEYFTVIITGSLIPVEGYEIIRKVTPIRVAVLLVNVGIVAYLVFQLLREKRARASGEAAPTA
jgi:uncharacterized membrane protein (DUF2068 family)